MFCKNCGTELKDGALFCHGCGAEIKKVQSAPVNENVIANTDVINEKPQPTEAQPTYAPSPFLQPYAMNTPVQSEKKDSSGFAVASLVLGIISLLPICCVNLITAILAFIFGLISLKSSKKGLAIAGIVLSIIAVLIAVVTIIFTFIGMAATSEIDYFFNDLYDEFMYY